MSVRSALGSDLLFGGGSIYERLRRHPDVEYDAHIAHAGLIYDDGYARILADVHEEYISIAREAGVPMLVSAGTYRANRERIAASAFSDRPVNEEHMRFVRRICADSSTDRAPLLAAGGLAPKGNAYDPREGLSADESERFHEYQVDALGKGGADVLVAWTLPALPEALGLARAMSRSGLPYLISFVVRDDGTLLDGSPLSEAVDRIDQETTEPPEGFFINCVHPTICGPALAASADVVHRVVGFKANTSALRPEELDGSEELLTEDPDVLAARVADLRRRFGLRFLAGCCGTGTEHMIAIARECARTE